jgi:hypothetical protein
MGDIEDRNMQAFGNNDGYNAGVLTINLSDLRDRGNNPIAASNVGYTPEQIIAILVKYWHEISFPLLGTDAQPIINRTIPVVSQASENAMIFETREGKKQIRHEVVFHLYLKDSTRFSAGNVVSETNN